MSGIAPQRRVRYQVRDGLAVMLFSLTASSLAALLLVALVGILGRTGV